MAGKMLSEIQSLEVGQPVLFQVRAIVVNCDLRITVNRRDETTYMMAISDESNRTDYDIACGKPFKLPSPLAMNDQELADIISNEWKEMIRKQDERDIRALIEKEKEHQKAQAVIVSRPSYKSARKAAREKARKELIDA